MKITVLTLFPETINSFLKESIVARAIEKKQVEVEVVNFRDFTTDNYKTVDDRPYGGGAGMVLKVEPIAKALIKAGNLKNKKIVLTSPRGIVFNQEKAREYSQIENLIIIAGHYEGFDERISTLIDEEVSLGDFVLTGGEIPAVAIIDSIVRLLPDVLKKTEATEIESFFSVDIDEVIESVGQTSRLLDLKNSGKTQIRLLEYSQYTRPEIFMDMKVPEVLLSGDLKKIRAWQLKNAYETTLNRRPDLLKL
jgi:tRNA (guanine37-N1)-methyltransferase